LKFSGIEIGFLLLSTWEVPCCMNRCEVGAKFHKLLTYAILEGNWSTTRSAPGKEPVGQKTWRTLQLVWLYFVAVA